MTEFPAPTTVDIDGDAFVDGVLYVDRHGDTWKYLGGIGEFLHVKRADEDVPVVGPNIVRHCENATAVARDFGPMSPAPGKALHIALATLADRWEQMAKAAPDFGDNLFIDEPTPVQLQQHARATTYGRAAADLREVLRTGRIPHGLMTGAELEQHASRMCAECPTPVPAGVTYCSTRCNNAGDRHDELDGDQ